MITELHKALFDVFKKLRPDVDVVLGTKHLKIAGAFPRIIMAPSTEGYTRGAAELASNGVKLHVEKPVATRTLMFNFWVQDKDYPEVELLTGQLLEQLQKTAFRQNKQSYSGTWHDGYEEEGDGITLMISGVAIAGLFVTPQTWVKIEHAVLTGDFRYLVTPILDSEIP